MSRQATNWEKMFVKGTSEKGLVSKVYKEMLIFNNKKTNSTIFLKNQPKTLTIPHQGNYKDGKVAHEKMFCIVCHQIKTTMI